MNDLELAITTATHAHAGQTDRAGEAYIQHPLRVMDTLDSRILKIVGVLHDTVEDSDVTVQEVRTTFGRRVAVAVELLTHDEDDSYMEYIEKVSSNPVASRVKMADLEDNMDLGRFDEVKQEDLERVNKYEVAFKKLEKETAFV